VDKMKAVPIIRICMVDATVMDIDAEETAVCAVLGDPPIVEYDGTLADQVVKM
jgi:hypothetical protein